ncbi:WD repeat-containing protein 26 [Lepeophtheirus salmonis]|uniref:CTLH domain-containing protein n=1 Tax=Lepeophtheirus salmonis TaxID=72036 RepID=A0A0K2UZ93_LEPSM|nr:WD repeat-containing protein 26-like [Lepeophtheirus salmonis]XP_040583154.1 WD repeat-containing protein 26-like [Lepeophtheirus salmonis]XP_040583155.1 WD repeat-containing protein 26-like [Lepeophtheirus salmonis]XP_040583156.1 WD repeat-containing protein 26-like [Lepeophtheirus salmonis]XP_040583157.1 WD repeat-containing protein 26-like [Lepeophtheirus salmonis]
MSAARSPPRKRVRSSHNPVVMESCDNETTGTSTTIASRSSSNNKNNYVHPSKNNFISNNNSICSDDDLFQEEEENEEEISCALIRKIPRRSAMLDTTEREVVRIIGQHLTNIGLKTSADVLMREAGCTLDQPKAATFKKLVMNGNWSESVKTLEDLKPHLENPGNLVEMKFLLLEQKYLEFLSNGNYIEALKVLQCEISPLQRNRERTHELSSYLMLSSPEDLAGVTSTCRPSTRPELMDRLQAYLPASIMLPPRRLTTLLAQAAEYQIDRCLYHNKVPAVERTNDSSRWKTDACYLPVDHQCSKKEFPCETIQILSEHCDEVWYCRFSPDGLKLATGSKDNTVIIWDFDPLTLKLKQNKTLTGHNRGVSYFAWSPDSTRLAVCGPEDSEEVNIWDVESGKLDGKISNSSDDSLTAVSWSPDGTKITCGGNRGNFFHCDTKGQLIDSWEGVRVQCLAFRGSGKAILAADTHHRIRSYSFDELVDHTILQEDHGIMTFSLDADDRHALLNIATQGIHMWDIEQKVLVRKFVGITQGFYTIHSCFGGVNQNFIASGSEDNKVYIYHVKRSTPIAVLSGHTRTVTSVSWNPVYPEVLVSASDDSTVRVWGPCEKYRRKVSTCSTLNGELINTNNTTTTTSSSTTSSSSSSSTSNGPEDSHSLDGDVSSNGLV